jgi:hypothetical protein
MKKSFFSLLAFTLFFLIIQAGLGSFSPAQVNETDNTQMVINAETIQSDDTVNVGLWLINIFNYQYISGNYIADMYIYFRWTNPNIQTIDWHFANGYPVTPTSVTLLANVTDGAVRTEVYRATANLNSAPDASDFPFDRINITVAINMVPHGNTVTLSWLEDQTELDSQHENSGWKTVDYELETSVNNFPLGVQVPRATLVVTQERQRVTQSFSPFIPPIFFALVCAVSFLFSLKEMAAVGLRIGLNTSMLVTTLLFSFGISATIPPASTMVLYTIFLLAVLLFMVSNLIVTIIGVVGWMKYKDEKRTRIANKLGFIISIIVPIVVFGIFFLLR